MCLSEKELSLFSLNPLNYHCEPNWRSHLHRSWSAHNPLLRLIVWVCGCGWWIFSTSWDSYWNLDTAEIHKTFDSPKRAEGKGNRGSLPARIWWCPPGVPLPLGGVSSSATLGRPSHLPQALAAGSRAQPRRCTSFPKTHEQPHTYRLIIPDTAFQFIPIRKLQGNFPSIPES